MRPLPRDRRHVRQRRALALAAVALAAACGRPAEAPATATAPSVTTAPVELRRLVDRIQATGDLIARDDATVASEVAGLVTEILVDEGQAVARGTSIVAIDPERRKLELDARRARLAEAEAAESEQRRATARVRELHAKNVASQAQLDSAELQLRLSSSRLAAARAELGLGERALRDAQVGAPFDGLIARRHVSHGDFVQPGAPLFDLVALDPIEVEFHLPEVDSARVRLGSEVEVRLSAYPDETFRATLSMITPRIDPQTRTLRVKGLIPNPDGRLRPGMFARVDLGVADRADVPMIPEEAILLRTEGPVVFRIVDGARVERRPLRTGAVRDGRVEVIEGLAAGDQVVVRGQSGLVDGAAVTVFGADSGTPPVASAPEARGTP
jgi:membrane fusion protein (multidrug efflux system)